MRVEDLVETPYAKILCYPEAEIPNAEVIERVEELKRMGVSSIAFQGRTQIGGLPVLGKGCVSIVTKALSKTTWVALKIRRLDANRDSMEAEAALLEVANSLGVGPRLVSASVNFLVMQLIEGLRFPEWLKTLKGKGCYKVCKEAVFKILFQCYRLDIGGIDHGELSNLSKHVLIADEPYVLDFESASKTRRVSNLTSATQYLFIGGPVAKKLQEIFRIRTGSDLLIASLREYKRQMNEEAFKKILSALNLAVYRLS